MSAVYDDVAIEYIKYRDDIPDEFLSNLMARGIDFEENQQSSERLL